MSAEQKFKMRRKKKKVLILGLEEELSGRALSSHGRGPWYHSQLWKKEKQTSKVLVLLASVQRFQYSVRMRPKVLTNNDNGNTDCHSQHHRKVSSNWRWGEC